MNLQYIETGIILINKQPGGELSIYKLITLVPKRHNSVIFNYLSIY